MTSPPSSGQSGAQGLPVAFTTSLKVPEFPRVCGHLIANAWIGLRPDQDTYMS
jgi:hypothetical protein